MPEIGKPPGLGGENKFKNIDMYKGPRKEDLDYQKRRKESVGDLLNQVAGQKKESMFTDRKVHNRMGKDEFVKLLAHQLQNQDPMNPMEQSKFTAELAQFAQLEQMTNMNTNFKTLTDATPTQGKFYAASFLGKEIITNGTTLDMRKEGEPSEIPFFLEGRAKKVMVNIFDDKNNLVRQIQADELPAGNNNLKWDGSSLAGVPQPAGKYRIAVQAWDESFQKVPSKTKVKGLIDSVTFEKGEPVFSVNGSKVYLRDVDKFSLPQQVSPKGGQRAMQGQQALNKKPVQ